jgi:hypothetical protein
MKPLLAVPFLLLIALSLVPGVGYAEHDYEIIVTIGDTTITSISPHTSVNIPLQSYTHAATGGTITISASPTNAPARVKVGNLVGEFNDTNDDVLYLLGARITANNTSVTNFPITFMRRYAEGPNTSPIKYYKTNANGTFQQALGSSILFGEYVKNPVSAGFTFLKSLQYTPNPPTYPLTFNKTISQGWPMPPTGANHLTGNRVLKVEVVLNLANQRYLDLGNGIRMYSSLAPACRPNEEECPPPPPMWLPHHLEAARDAGSTMTNPVRAK